ncbi:AraC family transcriptional regulator ligand-binding domain-containing protein [Bradyrhizobium japonicum]|uniref:AraC family transcriptional regulator ligand-binding domain-containing protein n=1 Tax=Bradyrhizobium japonicum TaxID=375 RepID=UPI003390B827
MGISPFFGPGWRPLDVHFTYPALRRREVYRRFFNCNVAFSAEFDAIICPAIDMERPMTAADASMAKYAMSCVGALAARSLTIDGKARELIVALPPTGRCSLDRVTPTSGLRRPHGSNVGWRSMAAASPRFSTCSGPKWWSA